MITSDYGRSASDTPHPRTPAAQLQLAGVSATSSRIGAVQVSAYVHTTSPHRLCAQVPTPINFDDPVYGDWSLTGGTDPDGNPVNMEGRSTEIMRRQSDGSWLDVIDDPYSQA